MPTARPRHMITESDRLAEALNAAGEIWPEERDERAALLRRVIDAGIESVESAAALRRGQRLTAITAAAGALTGTWPRGCRDEMRDEWPA